MRTGDVVRSVAAMGAAVVVFFPGQAAGGPKACRTDVQCPGDAVCENGVCVDPTSVRSTASGADSVESLPGACNANRDCPDSQRCELGRCVGSRAIGPTSSIDFFAQINLFGDVGGRLEPSSLASGSPSTTVDTSGWTVGAGVRLPVTERVEFRPVFAFGQSMGGKREFAISSSSRIPMRLTIEGGFYGRFEPQLAYRIPVSSEATGRGIELVSLWVAPITIALTAAEQVLQSFDSPYGTKHSIMGTVGYALGGDVDVRVKSARLVFTPLAFERGWTWSWNFDNAFFSGDQWVTRYSFRAGVLF